MRTARNGARGLDPLIVEKNLPSWASSRIIARGRDYYRRGRVLELESADDGHVAAVVEGSGSEPYRVEVRFDAGGFPRSRCACPFTWEPLCKHAVAALLAWQQEETGSEPRLGPPAELAPAEGKGWLSHISELAAVEREERAGRAGEQGLRVLERPARGLLGTYRVGSADPARRGERYRVVLRDAQWRHASCECLDFRVNELGTCKHIERVRLSLGAGAGRRLETEAARGRRAWAYLASRPSHERLPGPVEQVRLHLPAALAAKAPAWLAEHVDKEGYLLGGSDAGRSRADFLGLVSRLGRHGVPVTVDPLAPETLSRADDDARWEARVAELAKDPAGHPAWRRSVGRMRLKLHPYQVQGILFAAAKRLAFLGDDMGLGKTAQAIGTALLLRELADARRVLVFCPASLKEQWRREINRVCDAGVSVIAGSARERDRQYRRPEGLFTVLNYELLYRDLGKVLALKPDLVVLDEAQRIKNWETKIAQAMRRLSAPHRLVLTGTPLENRLAELQGILEFLDPQALGAPWKLMPTYALLDEEGRVRGYTRLDHLRGRLSRRLLRRTRPEVLAQLPPRTDNSFWTPITPDQSAVHDELVKQVVRLYNKWKRFKRLTREDLQRLFMLLTGMRVVCNAYGQYDWKAVEGEVLAARALGGALKARIGSPKLEEFRRVLAELLEVPGRKVVVFSQWERMLRLAELYARDVLAEKGSRHVMFTGKLSLRKRDAEVRRFIADPGTRVFFSTDAGGVGLNLQEAAACVVNLEMPWNPSVLEQRVGRVHRMGQKRSVQVVNLVSSECIEERIYNLVAQKKALFTGIFDGATREIRFTAGQTASFMDKMKALLPGLESGRGAPSEAAAPEAVARAAEDSLAENPPVPEPAPRAPALPAAAELAPALAALAAQARVSTDSEGVHISLPRPAAEVLRGLRPLLEGLLALCPPRG